MRMVEMASRVQREQGHGTNRAHLLECSLIFGVGRSITVTFIITTLAVLWSVVDGGVLGWCLLNDGLWTTSFREFKCAVEQSSDVPTIIPLLRPPQLHLKVGNLCESAVGAG